MTPGILDVSRRRDHKVVGSWSRHFGSFAWPYDARCMVDAVDGYETGPDATVRAAAAAWGRLDTARAVVLVEGVSDQIAVEATASVQGHDLSADGVVVLPLGGAHAIGNALVRLQERPDDLVIAGLCDLAEAPQFRQAIAAAGLGEVTDRAGLEVLGFFVCVDDLEDELLRAAGPDLVDQVMIAQGDRSSFATLQAQPSWRDAPYDAQVRRFIAAGARRKHRYAAAIVRALGPDRAPAPLRGVLAHVAS